MLKRIKLAVSTLTVIPSAAFVHAAQDAAESIVLIVPDRFTVVQLATDLTRMKSLVVMAYAADSEPAEPLIGQQIPPCRHHVLLGLAPLTARAQCDNMPSEQVSWLAERCRVHLRADSGPFA